MRPDLVILCPRNRNKGVCNVAAEAALPGVERVTPYNPQSVDAKLKGDVRDIARDAHALVWLVIEFTVVRDHQYGVSAGIGLIEDAVRAKVQPILLIDKDWAWRQKLKFYGSFIVDPEFDDEEGPRKCFEHARKFMPNYPLVVTDEAHIESDLTRKLVEMQKDLYGED